MFSPFSSPEGQMQSGLSYFLQGWRLICQRSLLPFIVIPILVNAVLMIGLIWLFFAQVGSLLDWLLPSWLEWLSVILVPLIFLMLLVLFYFTFTALANFIAAPFNAILSEKVELQLTGEPLGEMSLAALLKDVPRMLKREWQKMMYSIPRLLAIFLLGFVPLIGQTVVPILAFVFGAWLIVIQYCDYPFDNHKISFAQMRRGLEQHKVMNYTFGSLVSFATMVPFINLVVMPVAVCGATAMWVNEYRYFFLARENPSFDPQDFQQLKDRKRLANKNARSLKP